MKHHKHQPTKAQQRIYKKNLANVRAVSEKLEEISGESKKAGSLE